MSPSKDRLIVIDAPLDPDEREPRVLEKIQHAQNNYRDLPYTNPCQGVLSNLSRPVKLLRLEVEPWLLPAPPPEYLFMVSVANYVSFIDSGGCREYADQLVQLVHNILPHKPLTIGVDHTLTGGPVQAISEEVDPSELTLIVLDCHLDAIPTSIRLGLIHYDLETNPDTIFDPRDPYIYNRAESYNPESFLLYLLEEGVVYPENTFIVGVADYPPRTAMQIEDERVKRYVDHYLGIIERGVHLLRKEDIAKHKDKLFSLKNDVSTRYVYISIDLDVGANATLYGVRHSDRTGLTLRDLRAVMDSLIALFKGGRELMGLDLMEIDIYRAGLTYHGRQDRTYQIAAEIASRFADFLS